jgi:hypothetical protein
MIGPTIEYKSGIVASHTCTVLQLTGTKVSAFQLLTIHY